MKRILVPTNCDESSEWAFRLATELSRQNNARVYLLRVIKTHGGAYFNRDGEIVQDQAHDVNIYKKQKEEETVRLKVWAERINKDAVQVVLYGGIAETILKTIQKYKVGLVIMGNKFVDNEPHRFFGELTSFLVRKTTTPILSLKSNITAQGLDNIVFANEFDGKLSFYDALQDLQHYCNAKVDMLRINYPKHEIAEDKVLENMDYFARINTIKNYSKTIHPSNEKHHEPGILDYISNHSCDLLAVKNIKRSSSSPLFSSKLSKHYFTELHISTLIYND
ncbi:MAG: universal stress protein [Vicingaceae bacterium]